MNDVIRPLTEADADAFHRLRLNALKEHPEAFEQSYESQLATPQGEVVARLRATAESDDAFVLGFFADGVLVGMVGFSRRRGEKVRHKGSIWGMYVAAEAQGRGYGRLLMQEALRRAKAMPGLEQVNLAVVQGNDVARSLYLSLGFEVYGLERRAVIVNGRYLDDEFMALRLR